mgnify:CR=1 FL=1
MQRRILFLSLFTLVGGLLAAQTFEAQNCEQFDPFENSTSFVLVVDRSGSMDGAGISQARRALRAFAASVRPEDRVALVSFADDVTIDRRFTSSPGQLSGAIGDLRAGGGTRLHDAIAAGVRLLSGEPGVRVIVYLTDGMDNRSNLTLGNIRQMNIGENTIVYGMGLGDVDHDALSRVSRASNGGYAVVRRPEQLETMYDTVRSTYYDRFDTDLSDAAALTVTSLPAGRPVSVNGREIGRTPMRLDGIDPATYDVEVGFDRGVWSCRAETREGTRTTISARERDVPLQLVIETAPTRAAVFLNGDYVGLSSMVPSAVEDGERDIAGQLTIEQVPPGRHTVRVVAAPELEFSPRQVMEFPVEVRDEHVYAKALIFLGRVEDIEGNRRRPAGATPTPSNPFGGSDDDPFGDIRSRVPD